MKHYYYTIFLIIVINGCIEPFEPEAAAYDSVLVVDGLFSNSDSPSQVFLSSSFGFSEDGGMPIESAEVIIEEQDGGQFVLTEVSPGTYQTHPDILKGQIGKSYRLVIETPDANKFFTEWQLMKASPPIENIRHEIVDLPNDNPLAAITKAARFFISTSDPNNKTLYYLWTWEETYQYSLRNPIYIRADFHGGPGGGDDEIIELGFDEFAGFLCYKTEKSTEIIIATTEDFTRDAVVDMPLHAIDNNSSKFSSRYSLLARQYAISEDYFKFLRTIEETNETSGGLFDPIPNEVFGNVKSANNDIPVLGYFGVGGISKLRIFVERDDIPDTFGALSGPICPVDTIGLNLTLLYSKMNGGLQLFNYNRSDFGGTILGYQLTEPPCSECSALEASNEEPDFW